VRPGGGRGKAPPYVEGPGHGDGRACGLFNLTFSAKRVPYAAACMAGTAPAPADARAAATAALDAPHASSAQARLLESARMRLRVVSDMPNELLTRAFDMPDAHAASTASTNSSE